MLVLTGSGWSVDSAYLSVLLALLPDSETEPEIEPEPETESGLLEVPEAEEEEEEEYRESIDEASSTSNPTASVMRGWPRLLPAPPRGTNVPWAVASGKKSMDRFRAVWEGRDGVEAEAEAEAARCDPLPSD